YLKTYRKLVDDYALPGTAVPHAPYSVSEKLFKMLWELNEDNSQALISIHNMETPAENELFLSNSGELITFYEEFGIPTHHLKPTNQSSIHYALQNMDPRKPTLFVHNTLCQRSEIRAAMEWNPQSYWVTCPSANLYIENRLPRYKEFLDEKATVAIGTDSLTSNWGLSILEEMKVIAKFQSFIPFEVLLQWSTYNGALALGLSDKLGSIEIGKRPGINLLYSEDGSEPESLSGEVKVRKLV
nr:amidohydrolase family protein [Saprospiraceae bacterium]